MAQNPGLEVGRFESPGGPHGILLLHGYTGAVPEVRPMAEYLAAQGMHVVAPLLPGHGTTAEDLNHRSWREVAEAAAEELYALQGQCERVFVGGLSMGGLLSLHLAQRIPEIAGVIPMAAALRLSDPLHRALPFLKHLIRSTPKSKDIHASVQDADSFALLWSYDRNPVRFAAELVLLMHHVRDRLRQIEQPLLIFHGLQDRAVPVRAAHEIASGVASEDVQLVLLPNSGHCMSVDGERQQVYEQAWQWIEDRS